MYGAAPTSVAQRLGIHHAEIAGADCFAVAGSHHRYLNRVIGIGLHRAASTAAVDKIVEWFRARGAPRVSVEVSPHARPAELPSLLEDRGFRHTGGTGKLWRDTSSVTRTHGPHSIRRIRPAEAEAWFEVFAGVFRHFRNRGDWFQQCVGRPGWQHYGAFDGKQMVGIGGLYVAGGVGHLVEGATLAAHRRAGIQRRIIETRVRAGLRSGARLFTSETAPPEPRTPLISYRNLGRVGFQLAYVRQGYRLELK